jgi:hypothetical protein
MVSQGSQSLALGLTMSAASQLVERLTVSCGFSRFRKSLCHDSKEITEATVLAQAATLSALSPSEPLPTIDRKATKG